MCLDFSKFIPDFNQRYFLMFLSTATHYQILVNSDTLMVASSTSMISQLSLLKVLVLSPSTRHRCSDFSKFIPDFNHRYFLRFLSTTTHSQILVNSDALMVASSTSMISRLSLLEVLMRCDRAVHICKRLVSKKKSHKHFFKTIGAVLKTCTMCNLPYISV